MAQIDTDGRFGIDAGISMSTPESASSSQYTTAPPG
jgi:hypothetical protein